MHKKGTRKVRLKIFLKPFNHLIPDYGLIFGKNVQPICIATQTKDDPNKWQNATVEVLGYATQDNTGSNGIDLKSAKLQVFSQKTCNEKIDKSYALSVQHALQGHPESGQSWEIHISAIVKNTGFNVQCTN